MNDKLTLAQRMANRLENAATIADNGRPPVKDDFRRVSATELRRLDSVNAELLEALQRVCGHGARTNAQIDADWDAARATLAKATGES